MLSELFEFILWRRGSIKRIVLAQTSLKKLIIGEFPTKCCKTKSIPKSIAYLRHLYLNLPISTELRANIKSKRIFFIVIVRIHLHIRSCPFFVLTLGNISLRQNTIITTTTTNKATCFSKQPLCALKILKTKLSIIMCISLV